MNRLGMSLQLIGLGYVVSSRGPYGFGRSRSKIHDSTNMYIKVNISPVYVEMNDDLQVPVADQGICVPVVHFLARLSLALILLAGNR